MAVLLASLAALVVAASAPITVETSLCALVENPAAFSGKVVRFRAGVLTDWQHGALLVDSGCRRGIALSSTDAVPPHEAKAFDEAMGTPLDLGTDKTATATFSGRFSFRPVKQRDVSDNPMKFDAQRIEAIQVYPFKLYSTPVFRPLQILTH